MKTMSKVVLGAAMMATMVVPVYADEVYASPKVKSFLASFERAPGKDTDMIDRSIKPVSPKAALFLASFERASGKDTDMIDRSVKALPPRTQANMAL